MACLKLTTVTGLNARGEHRNYVLLDHSDPEAALRDARQLGITGEVEINHTDSHTIRHPGPSDEAA